MSFEERLNVLNKNLDPSPERKFIYDYLSESSICSNEKLTMLEKQYKDMTILTPAQMTKNRRHSSIIAEAGAFWGRTHSILDQRRQKIDPHLVEETIKDKQNRFVPPLAVKFYDYKHRTHVVRAKKVT